MLPTRKATRNLVGKTLTELDVQKKYDDITQSKHRISKAEAIKAIKRFFKPGDIEVTAKNVPLICPLSKSRIVTPVRGLFCKHVECFDLRSFLEYHTNDAYWECPFTFCRTKLNCDQLRFDEFFSSILQNTRSTIAEAEIRPDGTWTSIKPSVMGAIVIKEEEPDEPQAPQAAASASIPVKEEPLEELSAEGAKDAVNFNAANPKSLVIRRVANATFKAAQNVKRNAIRRQWKRGAVMKAGCKHQGISKGSSKTQHSQATPTARGQRCKKAKLLASPATMEDHAPAEQSPATIWQTSLPKPLSEATQHSTDAAGPSLSKAANESTTSERFVRGTTGEDEQAQRALIRNPPAHSKISESNPTTLLAAKDLVRTTPAPHDSESRPARVPSPSKKNPSTWVSCRCGITKAEWTQGLHDGLNCDVMKRLLEKYRTLGFYQSPKGLRQTARKASASYPVDPAGVSPSRKKNQNAWMSCRCGITKAEWDRGLHDGLRCDVMKRLLENYRTLGYQPPKGPIQTARKTSGSEHSIQLGVGPSRVTTKAPPPP
ncbi:MIZ/SPRING zinc finger domain containing protein [Aphelenchoides avenae]|nr:MIZ/SPRING zinc finger domain containing protein [Aphelenchus avenae]